MLTSKDAKTVSYTVRRIRSSSQNECNRIVLRVSVGAAPFTGKPFEAIMQWMSKQRRNIPQVLLIADTLARHNLISINNLSNKAAASQAKQEGVRWYRANSSQIRIAKNHIRDFKLCRWNEWLEHPLYQELREEYQNLYENNSEFNAAVSRDVERFVNSRRQKGAELNWSLVYDLSVKFVLEELTVHKLDMDLNGGCHAYPSDPLHSEVFLASEISKIPPMLQYKNFSFIRLKIERAETRRKRK